MNATLLADWGYWVGGEHFRNTVNRPVTILSQPDRGAGRFLCRFRFEDGGEAEAVPQALMAENEARDLLAALGL
jgi:hypothetical protein